MDEHTMISSEEGSAERQDHREGNGMNATHAGRYPVRRVPQTRILSASNDRGGKGGSVVLRPGRSEPRARSLEHLVGSLTEQTDRLREDVLGAVEVDLPVASVRDLAEHLAIHDGVGPRFVRRPTLDRDLVGEVGWHGAQ